VTATKLLALDAPTFTVDRSYLQTGASGKVDVPSPAFLIEHPKGLVLLDTSLDPRVYDDDPTEVYGAALAERVGIRARPDQRPDRQLAAWGYRVADVDQIVLSHLHFDHLGGLSLFPEATVLVGPGEFEAAYSPTRAQAGVYRTDEVDRAAAATVRHLPAADVDLFDDGSVVLLRTPGHTCGELSLLVRLPHRNVILTGDTVHCREHLERRVPYYNDANPTAAVNSLDRILSIRDEYEATVWISHDPDDWSDYAGTDTFV
jgi:N-acyl homoserine lactone hydrolase